MKNILLTWLLFTLLATAIVFGIKEMVYAGLNTAFSFLPV